MELEPEPELGGMPEPDLEALIQCVEREIQYRRHVYPRRIAAGRMSMELARRQIGLMEAIKRNLERQLNLGC